jgi:hypothetical protein
VEDPGQAKVRDVDVDVLLAIRGTEEVLRLRSLDEPKRRGIFGNWYLEIPVNDTCCDVGVLLECSPSLWR